MNAQQFSANLFLSFEILDADTMRLYSIWGTETQDIKAADQTTRRLVELFYEFGGGSDAFDALVYLAQSGNIQDFATLESAPRDFSEHYPDTLPGQWDFAGWTAAFFAALDAEGKARFLDVMDAYFSAYHEGKDLWERCSTKYSELFENSFLTNGSDFVQIIQQNGATTFVFDGKTTFALADDGMHPISSEQMPEKALKAILAGRAKYDEQNDENKAQVVTWMGKDAEKAEKAAAKTAEKAEKAAQRTETKKAKLAEKANEAQQAAETSATLLVEFFTLSKTAGIDELKEWMVNNQKSLIGKPDEQGNSDRKQAADLFRSLKLAAEQAAKDAEKAAKAAEAAEAKKAAEAADVTASKTPTKKGKKEKTDHLTAEQVEYEMAG